MSEQRIISTNMPRNVEAVRIRQVNAKPYRSPDIDRFLAKKDIAILYKRWKDEWPTPLGLRGGALSITCALILEVGFGKLSKVYGVRRAKLFTVAAKRGEA